MTCATSAACCTKCMLHPAASYRLWPAPALAGMADPQRMNPSPAVSSRDLVGTHHPVPPGGNLRPHRVQAGCRRSCRLGTKFLLNLARRLAKYHGDHIHRHCQASHGEGSCGPVPVLCGPVRDCQSSIFQRRVDRYGVRRALGTELTSTSLIVRNCVVSPARMPAPTL